MTSLSDDTRSTQPYLSDVPLRPDLVILPKAASTPMDRAVEMRRIRKHFVLNIIRQQSALSRAEIAKSAALNLPSVAALVDELISDGLVKEEEARRSIRGRRPIPVFLREDAASVLGIDIGKKSTAMLLANLKGQPIVSFERSTPALSSPQDYTDWALDAARQILIQAAPFMPPLCGIGVAVPGLVADSPIGETVAAGTVNSGESWLAVEAIRLALTEAFGVEVLVDNDARLCVTGATWFSNGRYKSKNLAVLNIGYGLGLGVMVNGHLLKGSKGFAGEIGHSPLGRLGLPCFCGRTGCLETEASGAAIARLAQESGLPTSEVEELAQLARQGDEQALAIFQQFGEDIGKAAATIMNLFNPEILILTGKVTRAADIFLNHIKTSMSSHALPASIADTQLIVEEPGKNLSLLGAVGVVLSQIFYTNHISVEEIL